MLAPFELFRPRTVDEAVYLWADAGGDAAWYAGGTELIPAIQLGLVEPGVLIDVKRIDELRSASVDATGALHVGAAVTYEQMLSSAPVVNGWPVLATAVKHVANSRVRAAGTMAGNLAFGEPRSDIAALLTALEATVIVRGGDGARRVAVEAFYDGAFAPRLADSELIVGTEVPPLQHSQRVVHKRFKTLERPSATVSVHATVDGGVLSAPPRFVVGAATETPTLCTAPAGLVTGAAPTDEQIAAAAAAAADEVDPIDDVTGSADYKRHLLRVLGDQALRELIREAAPVPDGRDA